MTDIQEKIGQEIKEAEAVCDADGKNSDACESALKAVEELKSVASTPSTPGPVSAALDNYCADNPDADECRIYED